jgi:hypothetical protein
MLLTLKREWNFMAASSAKKTQRAFGGFVEMIDGASYGRQNNIVKRRIKLWKKLN